MPMPRTLLLLLLAAPGLIHAQSAVDAAGLALRRHEAMAALDRYLETWNSRDAATWASSLHFPHVRPGPGAFEMTRSPEEYIKGVDFAATLKTGWHHSEWVTREVLQVGVDKIHASGTWQRYTADEKPLAGSDITYVITRQRDRWGVQARFAAGVNGIDAAAAKKNSAAALDAFSVFMKAWNSHDPQALADAIHYPHVRIADGAVEVWRSAADYLSGPEPGRQRTWHQTRIDSTKVVQATATGVNIVVTFSRLARDGRALSTDEGLFLVIVRDGSWKLQARSTFGS
jgi:hypothetical protein